MTRRTKRPRLKSRAPRADKTGMKRLLLLCCLSAVFGVALSLAVVL